MTIRSAAVCTVLAVTVSLNAGSRQTQAGRLNAAVVGKVVNGLTGAPIAYAHVSLEESPILDEGVVTDTQGRFVLRSLPNGPFNLYASTGNWSGPIAGSGSYGQQAWSSPARKIEVADGQVLRDLTVPIWPEGSVTGHVTDAFGEPLAGVTIDEGAGQTRNASSFRRLASEGRVVTDDRGLYRFSRAPGSFLLSASTDQKRRLTAPVATRDVTLVFPRVFYPNVASETNAQQISLKPGGERTIDFQLTATPSTTVSGVVVSTTGSSAGLWVTLAPESGVMASARRFETDAAGRFAFLGVSAGRYVLDTRPVRGCHGVEHDEESGRAILPVEADDIAGLRLQMRPCPRLTGDIQFAGAKRPSPAAIGGMWIGATEPGVAPLFSTLGTAGGVQPSGAIDIQVPSGRQMLYVKPPDGWMVTTISVDGRDATDRPIDIQAGSTNHIVVRLTDALSTISGVARPKPGMLDDTANMVLFPVNQAERTRPLPPRRVRDYRVLKGVFSFDDVPPGEYFIVALSDPGRHTWTQPADLGRLESVAKRISLAAGQRLELSLDMVDASTLPAATAVSSPAESEPLPIIQTSSLAKPSVHVEAISGRVIAADSSAPIAGAVLTLVRTPITVVDTTFKDPGPEQWEIHTWGSESTTIGTAISDEAGRFSFVDLSDGEYTMQADRPPFARTAFGAGRFPGPPMTLVFRRGTPLRELEVRMQPGAVVQGRVVDDKGVPLVDAGVELYRLDRTIRGHVVDHGPFKMVSTDAQGRFRMWGVEPGEYGALALPSSPYNLSMTTAQDLAQPLKGASGQTAATGTRLLRYQAEVLPAGLSLTGDATSGFIVAAGEESEISFRLLPGQAAADAAAFPLERQSRPSVSGRVVFADQSEPANSSEVNVVIKPLRLVWVPQGWRGSPIERTGSFFIKEPYQDRYQWGVVGPPTARGHWIVTSVVVNGRESLDAGTHTTDDGRMDQIVVTLSDQGASITGVVDRRGASTVTAFDGVHVVLFPEDPSARLPQSPRLRAVRPDSDGRFTIEDLVPGDYRITTLKDVPNGAWWDVDVLNAAAVGAMPVRLMKGENRSLVVR